MHGAVCRGGREAGVPTPINDTLWAAVHGLERRLELDRRGGAVRRCRTARRSAAARSSWACSARAMCASATTKPWTTPG